MDVIAPLFSGLLSNTIIELIKVIPYLSGDEKTKLAKSVTRVISIIVPIFIGWVVAWVNEQYGTDTNATVVMLGSFATSWTAHEARKANRKQSSESAESESSL